MHFPFEIVAFGAFRSLGEITDVGTPYALQFQSAAGYSKKHIAKSLCTNGLCDNGHSSAVPFSPLARALRKSSTELKVFNQN